jgi:hypothetical protein
MTLRARRLAAACALVMTIVLAAVAPSAARASDPQGASVPFTLADRQVGYREQVVARGRAAEAARRVVALVARTGAGWTTLATTTAGPDGSFRLAGRMTRSAEVRVVAASPAVVRAAAAGPPAATVAVGAGVGTHARRLDILAGSRAVVRGTLRPGGAGRAVALEVRRGGRWVAVDRARTDAAGRFALTVRGSRPGSVPARVRFAGDLLNAPATRDVGRLNVYRRASVSWYGPGLFGSRLACGGTLSASTLGVANRSLPCGARVSLRYRGRTVRVPVIDRGPFVGGREYDLTAATAQRLGFHATGTVWTTR